MYPIPLLLFWSWIVCPPGQASTSAGLHHPSLHLLYFALDLLPRYLSAPAFLRHVMLLLPLTPPMVVVWGDYWFTENFEGCEGKSGTVSQSYHHFIRVYVYEILYLAGEGILEVVLLIAAIAGFG